MVHTRLPVAQPLAGEDEYAGPVFESLNRGKVLEFVVRARVFDRVMFPFWRNDQ